MEHFEEIIAETSSQLKENGLQQERAVGEQAVQVAALSCEINAAEAHLDLLHCQLEMMHAQIHAQAATQKLALSGALSSGSVRVAEMEEVAELRGHVGSLTRKVTDLSEELAVSKRSQRRSESKRGARSSERKQREALKMLTSEAGEAQAKADAARILEEETKQSGMMYGRMSTTNKLFKRGGRTPQACTYACMHVEEGAPRRHICMHACM